MARHTKRIPAPWDFHPWEEEDALAFQALERGVASDGQQNLNIQVTRAVSDQKIWRQLGQSGSVISDTTIEQAADDLFACARAKAKKIPNNDRTEEAYILE